MSEVHQAKVLPLKHVRRVGLRRGSVIGWYQPAQGANGKSQANSISSQIQSLILVEAYLAPVSISMMYRIRKWRRGNECELRAYFDTIISDEVRFSVSFNWSTSIPKTPNSNVACKRCREGKRHCSRETYYTALIAHSELHISLKESHYNSKLTWHGQGWSCMCIRLVVTRFAPNTTTRSLGWELRQHWLLSSILSSVTTKQSYCTKVARSCPGHFGSSLCC